MNPAPSRSHQKGLGSAKLTIDGETRAVPKDRAYSSSADFEKIRDFLARARAIHGPCGYPHPGELAWKMYDPYKKLDWSQSIHMWEDEDGQLIGFLWFEEPNGADFFPDPSKLGQDLELQMLRWVEDQITSRSDAASPLVLETGVVCERDEHRIQFFLSNGFQRKQNYFFRFRRSLSVPIADAPLAEGFVIRHVEGAADFQQIADGYPEKFPAHEWARHAESPCYVPELHLVAVAPDGTFASRCICWFDDRDKTGVFEPVGTEPHYQRMGLAKATMTEALRRLKMLGAREALVSAHSANEAAIRLYESVGFERAGSHLEFTKTISRASSATTGPMGPTQSRLSTYFCDLARRRLLSF